MAVLHFFLLRHAPGIGDESLHMQGKPAFSGAAWAYGGPDFRQTDKLTFGGGGCIIRASKKMLPDRVHI